MTASLGGTEGSVTFTGGAVAIGIGFQWGSGTLTYQGQQYPFRVNGLSVVDVGVTRVTGSGSVHNLRNVADFSGNYVSIAAGVTVAGGGSVGSLRNQNGVVIDGVTTTQGVRLTLAPGGVSITLSGQPSWKIPPLQGFRADQPTEACGSAKAALRGMPRCGTVQAPRARRIGPDSGRRGPTLAAHQLGEQRRSHWGGGTSINAQAAIRRPLHALLLRADASGRAPGGPCSSPALALGLRAHGVSRHCCEASR